MLLMPRFTEPLGQKCGAPPGGLLALKRSGSGNHEPWHSNGIASCCPVGRKVFPRCKFYCNV